MHKHLDSPLSPLELQMRLKDPFFLKAAEMTKRTNKPRKPRDEDSSDEVSGKSRKQHKAPVSEANIEGVNCRP